MTPITAIVGPNGSGKSNVAEAMSFVLGEQSIKSMRGKRGEDLIWGGSPSVPRSSRAFVKLVFDNRRRILNVDYDEVSIERVVHRDSSNQYFINGSQTRLRDIQELLASAYIGAGGNHIISQGEADRILAINAKERRVAIEDALGLKIYQYKKEESRRKLQKTEENMEIVERLRKEIAPHIRFLKKQTEKVEHAAAIKEELRALLHEYLSKEASYIFSKGTEFKKELADPVAELSLLQKELEETKKIASKSENKKEYEIAEKLEKEISALNGEKDELGRALGRIEGEIASEKRAMEKYSARKAAEEGAMVAFSEVENFSGELDKLLKSAETSQEKFSLKEIFSRIRELMTSFLKKHRIGGKDNSTGEESEKHLKTLLGRNKELSQKLSVLSEEKTALERKLHSMKKAAEEEADMSRSAERKMFQILSRQSELKSTVSEIKFKLDRLEAEEVSFKREVFEATELLGREFSKYAGAQNVSFAPDEARAKQEERRQKMERMKIRLEEAGGGSNAELMKEYKEVTERDEFLAKEIKDLQKSAASLEELIADMEEKLEKEFADGLKKINEHFKEFFSLMFGGGDASLLPVKQIKRVKTDILSELEDDGASAETKEEPAEDGIEVNVSLPRKKIKGLQMLSGGERALTSIALLFALSQVNPPPFIVLDETDAALDEANSKKYGDMVENLSKSSQLILITHNRETMSRAGVLYGVTMGSDGISKLLSVSFDEAVAVAK